MPNNARMGSEGGDLEPALTKHQRKIEVQRAYRQTPAGKAAYQRYNESQARAESGIKYNRSQSGRMMRRMWDRRPEVLRKKRISEQIRRQNGR